MSLPDKFSTFYGTRSFISMCTRSCHWSLSSDRGHVATFRVASSLQVVAPILFMHFSSWCACHIYTQLSCVYITILLVFGKEHKFHYAVCSIWLLPFWVQIVCIASISWAHLFCFLSVKVESFIPIQNNMQNYYIVDVVSTSMFLDRFWIACYEALSECNKLTLFPWKQFLCHYQMLPQ
jgi:hypothetical protein